MKDIIMKILFVLGVIAIVIMVVFGILKVVPKIVSSLASAGSAIGGNIYNRESINLLTNTDQIASGDSFTLSFEHVNPAVVDGVYAFTYNCSESLGFKIVGKNDAEQTVICNRPFSLSDEPIQIELIGSLNEKDSLRDATIAINFTPNGERAPTVRGEKVITVQSVNVRDGDLANTSVTITTDYQALNNREDLDSNSDSNNDSNDSSNNSGNTNNNSDNVNPNPSPNTGGGSTIPVTPVFRAPADLAISNVRANGTRVQFTVANTGGRSTGAWSFNYTLPTNPVTTQNSGLQISLNPGESLGFTLDINDTRGFTSGVISIFVNPLGQATESSLANNNGITTITYSGTGGGNGNGNFDPSDDADLVITSAEVGYISGNRFIEDDSIDEDDEAAIQFTVANRGGRSTGGWRFEVDLPTEDREVFRSSNQASLAPGASITFTLEFDNLERGNNQDIRIEIDSDDDVDEESESNNSRTLDIDIR